MIEKVKADLNTGTSVTLTLNFDTACDLQEVLGLLSIHLIEDQLQPIIYGDKEDQNRTARKLHESTDAIYVELFNIIGE